MEGKTGKILFSVDLEEFDITEEYGQMLPLRTKLEVSLEGMQNLDRMMQQTGVTGTIFTTAFWAQHYRGYVQELSQRYEIASHTFYHDRFEEKDLRSSRELLRAITGKEIGGLRMPLMQTLPAEAVAAAGYTYDSSLHPTWLPGRYNHLRSPRTPHYNKLWILPASVTPVLRIPVFWLTFKNAPFALYRRLCKNILERDGYIVLYVHPWEFTDLSGYQLPAIIRRKDGAALLKRLEKLFRHFLEEGYTFSTHEQFIAEWQQHRS